MRFLLTIFCVILSAHALPAGGAQEAPDSPGAQEAPEADAEDGSDRSGRPGAFDERTDERRRMVRNQIEGRSITNPRVLEALETVPRHEFVPSGQRSAAYADRPLPIGHGQTISQPYIVAYMTEELELRPGDRVLEIGTGSGYQAAVLAEIVDEVYTIEIIEALADRAKKTFDRLGYDNVHVRVGDGYHGWPEHAPYDAIIVTAAAGHLPPPLVEQLSDEGKIVIPIGPVYQVQTLMEVTKTASGDVRTRQLLPVRFVPMTGEAQVGEDQ